MKLLSFVLVPSIGFLITTLIFFYPVLFQKYPIPSDALVGLYHPWRDAYAEEYPRGIPFKNFLITDPVRQHIPWRKVAIDSWKNGEVPGWNPFSFSGTSLLGNIQAAVFYPINIVFWLFDFLPAWTILIMAQPLVAGIFFYGYARTLKMHGVASFVGAIAWSYSGYMIAWLTWGTLGHVALWLPLILIALERITEEKKRRRWGSILAVALLCQTLGGHMQISLYIWSISVIYASWLWLRQSKKERSGYGITVLIAALAAIGISAIQWIPVWRGLALSSRIGSESSWASPGWFLPWRQLIQFIVPDYFGNPATLNYFGEWNYGEMIGYIGILPFIFACCAVFIWRNRYTAFWFCVLGLSIMLMVPSVFTRMLYQLHLPIYSVLQPTRLMVLVDFSLAILATVGIDYWIRKRSQAPLVFSLILSVCLLCIYVINSATGSNRLADEMLQMQISTRNSLLPLALAGITVLYTLYMKVVTNKPRLQQVGLLLLVGIVVFDVFRFGWKFTPFAPAKYFFPETAIIQFLKRQEAPFRVMTTDDRILPPNVLAYYGIESIEGYDPVYLDSYDRYLRGVDISQDATLYRRIVAPHDIDSAMRDRLNVKYVLSLDDLVDPALTLVFAEGDTRVYENSTVLPRAYAEDTGVANIISYSGSSLVVQVSTDKGTVLHTSIPYFRGWRVVLDGAPHMITHESDNPFIHATVPPGLHTIKIQYNPIDLYTL